MSAKFLSSSLMVTVLMAFLAAVEACRSNFMPTFLRDVIHLAPFSALANSVTCRVYMLRLPDSRTVLAAGPTLTPASHVFSAEAPDDCAVCFWSFLKYGVVVFESRQCCPWGNTEHGSLPIPTGSNRDRV